LPARWFILVQHVLDYASLNELIRKTGSSLNLEAKYGVPLTGEQPPRRRRICIGAAGRGI
jgi:hypothetical protein